MDNRFAIFGFAPTSATLANGNVVKVRRLSALDKLDFVEYLGSRDGKGDVRASVEINAELLAKALIDDDGKPYFGAASEVIAAMDLADVLSVGKIALDHNAFSADGQESVKKK
jgi:hypothetical protein